MKMKTLFLILFVAQAISCNSQPAKIDSVNAYLGKTPPGKTPEIFLSNSNARLTISDDGKSIYYTSNVPTGKNVYYYRFSNDKWNGPFFLYDGNFGPTLSTHGDTLITMVWDTWRSYYSIKKDSTWGTPTLFSEKVLYYLQQTDLGNYYCGAEKIEGGFGQWDMYKVTIDNGNVSYENIGRPINTTNNDVEYFIARDESYIIVGANEGGPGGRDLYISYRKEDKTWTNPKSLGAKINNSSDYKWGPYVSADNKYLFYSSEPYPYRIYWVRFDNLLDSLRHTNFAPYVLNNIPDQIDSVGKDYSYRIQNNTFFDDDGNNTFSLSVSLSNGKSLPDYLVFDAETNTISGNLEEEERLTLKVTATDTAGASVSDVFILNIKQSTTAIDAMDFSNKLSVYPNPASHSLRISSTELLFKNNEYQIIDRNGKIVKYGVLDSEILDVSDLSKGVFTLSLQINQQRVNKKIVID
jgi:hypothetical protein